MTEALLGSKENYTDFKIVQATVGRAYIARNCTKTTKRATSFSRKTRKRWDGCIVKNLPVNAVDLRDSLTAPVYS